MSDEQQIEQEIQDKGLNAPRLTPADIDDTIALSSYTVLPSGKTVVCELILKNGFSVVGHSSCVSIENFDKEIGEKIAYRNAREQIWLLEGYLLTELIHQSQQAETGV